MPQTRKRTRRGKSKTSKVRIPISSSGEMGKYGYKNVVKKSVAERHASLERMIEEESKRLNISQEEKTRNLIARLNAVAIVTKNTNPRVSKIFRQDQQWLSKKLDEMNKDYE